MVISDNQVGGDEVRLPVRDEGGEHGEEEIEDDVDLASGGERVLARCEGEPRRRQAGQLSTGVVDDYRVSASSETGARGTSTPEPPPTITLSCLRLVTPPCAACRSFRP